jgi:predicted mannosyl-3-phosphoglycerate phosphatase (HAD superfamily)
VATIVAENGSVRLSCENGRLVKHHWADEATRRHQHDILMRVLEQVERTVPGARRAADSAGRETDIAIDHSEHTHLPPERVAEVVALMRSHGLSVTVSSIHINGWLGKHSKWTGACWAVQAVLGQDLASQRERWVYVGDSTNDQVMFEQLPLSVGVANIRRFWPQLIHRPRHVTRHERGQGFAELVSHLLQQPSAPTAG